MNELRKTNRKCYPLVVFKNYEGSLMRPHNFITSITWHGILRSVARNSHALGSNAPLLWMSYRPTDSLIEAVQKGIQAWTYS